MKSPIIFLAVCFPLASLSAENSYIKEFEAADAIEKSDPDRAYDGFMRSYELAVIAGDANYATSAGLNACFIQHEKELTVEAGKLALQVIDGIHPLPTKMGGNDILRRAQLFGFLQGGLLEEGKIGRSWQANRATAETLRGKKLASSADGTSISFDEVIQMNSNLRGLGWRLLEKETSLLDLVGQTNQARELLDQVASHLGDSWVRGPSNERFYAFKILSARTKILDFLGYEQEALAAQQELVAAGKMARIAERSRLILEVNLLLNLSQWNGPSENLVSQVREIDARLKELGMKFGASRVLANMELALRGHEDARKALGEESRENKKLGHLFEALYADRDALIADANNGKDDLDPEYARLLGNMRSVGNKRGEPTLYREYGSYLLDRNRSAEAIAMFSEALRLSRSFGWTLHEPQLLCLLFDARFQAGDHAGALDTLSEIESWLQANPQAPAVRKALAAGARAKALAQLGNLDAAKAALALAREFAKDLPDYRKSWLNEEVEVAISQANATSLASAEKTIPFLKVQPLEVVSLAAPGDAARTRFTVFNPTNTRIHGEWVVSGNGAALLNQEMLFDASKPSATVSIPQTLGVGSSSQLVALIRPAEEVMQSEVKVAWKNHAHSAGPTSTWSIHWDDAATRSVVLDASSIESNPFRYSSLFHEIAMPLGEERGLPVRLRSTVPLRLEYYEARSQRLLAIDANGNGDFTESGDLFMNHHSGIAAAFIPAVAKERQVSLDVHIFATQYAASAPRKAPVILEVEVFRNGAWTKEAEDIVK